jgi:AcrR family transcriptional regulator
MAKKSERTRQRIIDAANRLFYHQGYHNTSFTDVVDATNIPRGNIYYYFKTKYDFLIGAIRHRT